MLGEAALSTGSFEACPVLVAGDLLGADVGEHGAEEFVVDDVPGTNTRPRLLVEGTCGQLDAAGPNADVTVVVFEDLQALAAGPVGLGGGFEDVEDALGVEGEISAQLPLDLTLEDILEHEVFGKGAVHVVGALWSTSEAPVVVLTEGVQLRISLGHRGRALEPQFFHESVLERLVGALDTPLGGRYSAEDPSQKIRRWLSSRADGCSRLVRPILVERCLNDEAVVARIGVMKARRSIGSGAFRP
ncbi:MAG: hypothetical protein AAF447_07465 [Myxococcota bacterium]